MGRPIADMEEYIFVGVFRRLTGLFLSIIGDQFRLDSKSTINAG